jgi:ABC-type sugar transport system ATPase subunit
MIKILTGAYIRDGGTVVFDGKEVEYRTPQQAQESGISTIYQEINLVPLRSVAENIMMGREPRRYGLLDWKLRQDERVIVLERTNARYITRELIPEPLDFAVIDASFISLQQLITPLVSLFGQKVRIMALVKPQFELPREKVGQGGIVRESGLHEEAMAMVRQFGKEAGLAFRGGVASPICGARGNQEFLLYFTT